MAIARGAGTEIIRSALHEDISDAGQEIIIGEQHHIYTVLSIIVQAQVIQAAGNFVKAWVLGYDAATGTTNRPFYLFQQDMQLGQTYVWNDKFSFNGFEPTNFTGAMNAVDDQNAIADQGSGVAQKLVINSEHADDNFDVVCTFIDQNNA